MSEQPHIVIIDSSRGDAELARSQIRQVLPRARVTLVEDSLDFAESLQGGAAQFVVIAPRLSWTGLERSLMLLRRTWPEALFLLFGHEEELTKQALDGDLPVQLVLRKSSRGFLAIGELIERELAMRSSGNSAAAGLGIADLPVAAMSIDEFGQILDINNACATQFRGSLIGREIDALCCDDIARAAWWKFVHDGAEQSEVRLRDASGNERTLLLRSTETAKSHYIGVLREPAEIPIHVLNGRPKTQSEPDWEGLAMMLSHDLREPLQQLERIADRFGQQFDQASDPKTERMVKQLSTASARASNMLDGLVDYLALDTDAELDSEVDLNECVELAVHLLEDSVEESGVRIVCDKLPRIPGNARQLSHLFMNLIGNSIKFRGEQTPLIEIRARTDESRCLIEFRDNGIGVPDSDRQRIFSPGMRLHRDAAHPGSGLGLALCQRIVERHRGSIRLEGTSGTGSVVIVELPQSRAQESKRA